jgi:hypothetical protein
MTQRILPTHFPSAQVWPTTAIMPGMGRSSAGRARGRCSAAKASASGRGRSGGRGPSGAAGGHASDELPLIELALPSDGHLDDAAIVGDSVADAFPDPSGMPEDFDFDDYSDILCVGRLELIPESVQVHVV